MSGGAKIIIVEDEPDIAGFLSTVLARNGYQCRRAATGREAISLTASGSPDLVLLDLGLPDIDGMSVLRSLRQWTGIPVVVISARQDEVDKVDALDAGADDYITKPFGNSELLARIRSALRRHPAAAGLRPGRFSAGGLDIDFARREVSRNSARVHLTPSEYRILALLARNAGRVLTHDYIIREVWGEHAGDAQVLRVHMANLRRKLEDNPADPQYIQTEMGVGYRLAD